MIKIQQLTILTSLLLLSFFTPAQKAKFNENSVSYSGKTYKIGDTIHLGYGSGNNKEFAFVSYGKSLGGVNLPGFYHHADANWSKADVEIIKLYNSNGVIWAKCDPKNRGSSLGSVLGNKIYINIEAAVDNKEIIGMDENTDKTTAETNTKIITTQTTTDTNAGTAPVPGKKETNNNQKTDKEINTANTTQKQTTTANTKTTDAGVINGKLYLRTVMWMGSGLEISWLFLGNNGMIIRDPKHGVNPVNYPAEAADNAANTGKYKIAGNKLYVSWQNGQTSEWPLEYNHGGLSAVDGGIVTQPDGMPANYRLSGQYAGGAVLPNVASTHTFVFSKDGTFTLNKYGTVYTPQITGQSESNSRGTYYITGNTLHLDFANGEKAVAVIWIWDEGEGGKHLVINKSSFPQER